MILTPLVVLIPLFAQAEKPVNLSRVFTKGEKLQYEVKAGLHIESKERGLNTWMPEEQDIVYKFTTEVTKIKSDGMAEIRYKRPIVTEIQGETVESGPKSKDIKLNMDLQIVLSPINELITIKDLSPKKKEKKPDEEGEGKNKSEARMPLAAKAPLQGQLGSILSAFNSDLYEMVLFLGPLDNCLDFSPKLPIDEVKPGDTWLKTGGYTPQKIANEGGKMAVLRLDYTYTYKGEVVVDGKKFLKIRAELSVETDIAEYIFQLFHVKAKDVDLKSVPYKFKAKMEFDLDPVTKRTVKVVATSEAEAQEIRTGPEPTAQVRFKGRTVMKLLSAKP